MVNNRDMTAAIFLDILNFCKIRITGSFIYETITAIIKGAKNGNKYVIDTYMITKIIMINRSFLTTP
jgi:hypothetical protein